MRRAFTLIELVISLAILTVCFFLIVPLMHYSFQYAVQVEKSNLAAMIAQSHLQELRAWSAQPSGSGYQFDQLASYPGGPTADSDHPEFSVEVRTGNCTLNSPTSIFEGLTPAPERRLMARTTRKVQVDVRWRAFGASQVSLVSLISSPTRRFKEINPLLISASIPGSLPQNGTIDLTVQALDDQGQDIPDLFYSWGVYPMTGSGSISFAARDGRSATFKNISRLATGTPYYTGGKCRVEVRATYRGEERWGLSQDINLQKT